MNTDGIAEEDLLGRDSFAREFARMIVSSRPNGSEGIVIGVTGKWGSGKTTFLSFAKKHLKELHEAQTAKDNSDAVIMNFNPWMYNGQKELQSIFLREVAEKSGNQNEALKTFLRTLSDRLLLPKILSSASVKVPGASVDLSKFTDLFKSDLEDLRRDVDEELITKNRRLYIVIDDLDRLEPQSILDMLQLIRLNAHFKNTTYILAYDKFYVHRVLQDLYKESGERYFEKIVQVEFGIPEIREDQLENIFFQQMKDFFAKFKIPYEESKFFDLWKYRGLRDFFLTLRDVYRFANSLQMRLPLVYREVNIYDFVMLECLRLFEHDFFDEIVSELAKGRYHRNFARIPFYEKDNKKHDRALQCFKFLNFFQTEVYAMQISNEKRFADPAYTERYIALSLSPKDIAQVEYDSFFHKAANGELSSFLKEVYRCGRMANLLRRLKASQEAETIDWYLIESFLLFWSEDYVCFNEFYIEVIDTLMHFIELSDDATGTMRRLIERLTVDVGKLNIVTFYLLYSFLEHFDNHPAFARLRMKVGALVNLKREEISQAYRKILQKWISGVMHHSSENRYGKMGWLFIAQYAKFEKVEYLKELQRLCEATHMPVYKDVLGFAREALFLSDDGRFYQFAPHTFDVLPKSYFASFKEVVRAIEDSELTPAELGIKKLFLEKAALLNKELSISNSL